MIIHSIPSILNNVKLSDLVLDASGLFLVLQLNQSLNIEEYPNCNKILNENILNAISSQYGDPQCIWYANNRLHIFPAYNADFSLNDINASSVLSLSNNLNPYIIIEAPTMINPCFNLTVSVKQTWDNIGRPLQYQWFIDNSPWYISPNKSQLVVPSHYLKLYSDSYLEIKLICHNWLGVSTTIFHTVYVQGIEFCDSNLGYIYINQGNKQQVQPNLNDYPLSITMNTIKSNSSSYSIQWHQELTPNVVGSKYQQLNFNNFKTGFDTNLIEWKYQYENHNDTILLPAFSTKHYNDYLFVVEVCDDLHSLCLQDYVFIRSKYPSPRSVVKESQIEHINPYRPNSPSMYKFDIDNFFNFNPLYLKEYNNDFELIYEQNEYQWSFECIGITSTGSEPNINCVRPLSVVGAFTRDSIVNRKIIELRMTAILTQYDNFISIYDLQQRQSLYPKETRSHTIIFYIGPDEPITVS